MTTASSDAAARALLPAGLTDVLPPQAAFEAETVERLMRTFAGFGYERVKPPLIEFEETLLAGSGSALGDQMFRLVDPISRRTLAIRPDITVQVARIATTRLKHRPRPLRLAYAGEVMRVSGSQLRPERQFGQVGAEIVGCTAPAADVEVIVMAATALEQIGIADLSVDLGLPTLVSALMSERGHGEAILRRLKLISERKDAAAADALAPELGRETASLLAKLMTTAGPAATALPALAEAPLPTRAGGLRAALFAVVEGLTAAAPALDMTVDAVESRGFEYHSGVTFSFFARGASGELGRGGRYRAGGSANEDATGVSLFMDAVLRSLPAPARPRRLFLPAGTDVDTSRQLRDAGWVTVAGLEAGQDAIAQACRLGCGHVWLDDRIREAGPVRENESEPGLG